MAERGREECVERQTVGFVSTEQFFSPVNRLISFIGGDHRKKTGREPPNGFEARVWAVVNVSHFFYL